MTYADRLEAAIARTANAALVGLDPHADSLPAEFAAVRDPQASRAEQAQACGEFLCQVIELVAGRVPAVKPQSAFFEIYGADGAQAWERVVATARAANLLVIGDVKRGDIDSTAAAYARAYLDPRVAGEAVCDAITVNPYLGGDAVQPFLDAARAHQAGIYVLVRTSNKQSGLFQDHGTPRLYERVASMVDEWGKSVLGQCGLSSIGAVVGATHPSELSALRALLPRTPFLIPGYGAQGAGAAEIAGGFLPRGRGALVNSSRGILFAHKQARYAGMHWKDASRAALDAMIAEVGALGR